MNNSLYKIVSSVTKIVFLLLCFNVHSQFDTTGYVKYTNEFKFKDGVFMNFQQVKDNNPILKSRIISNVKYDDPDFFNILSEKGEVFYYDEYGIKESIETSKIWGYSLYGILYIRISGGFNRITYIGALSHFVASITVYSPYYDNMFAAGPYYSYNNYMSQNNNSSTEIKQFVLDFSSGKIYNYDVDNIKLLLMKDTELYDEYINLKNKKKKQLKFLYLRKYNEKHPIYIKNDM